MSAGIVVFVGFAVLILGERLLPAEWLATAAVAAGLFLLGSSLAAEGGAASADLARERKEEAAPVKGRPRHFAFRWAAPEKTFAVQIRFRKARASKDEVISALRSLLQQLESAD